MALTVFWTSTPTVRAAAAAAGRAGLGQNAPARLLDIILEARPGLLGMELLPPGPERDGIVARGHVDFSSAFFHGLASLIEIGVGRAAGVEDALPGLAGRGGGAQPLVASRPDVGEGHVGLRLGVVDSGRPALL